jgi:hypothetical protein
MAVTYMEMNRFCRQPALRTALVLLAGTILAFPASAGVGDPQVRTDHMWYPGELACSTFERLARTQAEVYERVTGVRPATDEQKALAAWLWRNAHYFHAEEGAEDVWGKGLGTGGDLRTREYWTGLFAHGFGLCGTTHSQWIAEMEALLGHNRGRGVGCAGHNSFEVFLTGGPYGAGKWVMLDHDQSTVVYNPEGSALIGLSEIAKDWKRLTDRGYLPQRQHGWLVCGLHPSDAGAYASYNVAEYLAGYSGPPPMVHLRRGEKLRRYLGPGLADGNTFVFWGHNYNTGGIPGPERAHTWVNQPDKMFRSTSGAGYKPGQARYGNAVYTYQPDFAGGSYREGIIGETADTVTFGFASPYIIGATPPNAKPWGIYDNGCKNGLVLHGKARCAVAVSTDRGGTWQRAGDFQDGIDLTDLVKGHRQYWLRLHAGAPALAKAGLTMTTVCQANAATMPRLKDGGSTVRFEASGRAVVSAGPNLPHAQAALVAGKFGTPSATLELQAPRKEPIVAIHAAAHVLSSNPPRPEVMYRIDYSTDGGKSWTPIVKDWSITRRGDEPGDFWSQSLVWGSIELAEQARGPVRVRFSNTGGKAFARAEAHLVYRADAGDVTKVTFAWTDDGGAHESPRVAAADKAVPWTLATGKNVRTRWVDFEPVASGGK